MLLLSTSVSGAWAQAPATAPSTNAMVNLVRLLVKQGTITEANGNALIAQAEADAQQANTNIAQASAAAGLPAPPAGTIRVPYVPETVRKQIRDEVKTEIMAQAKAEGWAAPGDAAPDWARRITISGDIRFRSQSELYSSANLSGPGNGLVDVGKINATAGGFDFFKNLNNAPVLNLLEDRTNRLRLRARFGVFARIGDSVTAGFKLATGDDNSPISTNQNLGGGLTKRSIWLDQAYLKIAPRDWINASFGRFPNPFRSTDLLFDNDINFDGVVANLDAKPWLPEGAKLAIRAGAFPLDFGSSDFPATSTSKSKYPAKWLLSGQIEGGYDFSNGLQIRAAAAYHYFHNVQGQLSAPCIFSGANVKLANGANDPEECSTDGTRSFSPRKGNTLFFIRDTRFPDTDTLAATNKQYLGLVYKYKILDLNASVSFPFSDKITATIDGNYVRNLAFRRSDDCRYGPDHAPVTNVTENNGNFVPCATTDPARVESGNQGFLVRGTVGYPKPKHWGEWSASASYRYLQTDAVLDSLTDSDFHLGGTNTKGYSIAGTMGLFDGVSLTGRWMSANEITGPPIAIDVLQVDLQVEF